MAIEKLITVKLYGRLGATFGWRHELAVKSPAEAVYALCKVVPGFKEYFTREGHQYAVFRGKKNIKAEEIKEWVGNEEIGIAPAPQGSKRAGVFQIVLGVVLFAVGFFVGGQTWGPALMMMGAGMAVGGVAMMLSPMPKGMDGEAVENRPSFGFNGPVNTIAQGNCVPLAYGRVLCGSAVISGGVYFEERT